MNVDQVGLCYATVSFSTHSEIKTQNCSLSQRERGHAGVWDWLKRYGPLILDGQILKTTKFVGEPAVSCAIAGRPTAKSDWFWKVCEAQLSEFTWRDAMVM